MNSVKIHPDLKQALQVQRSSDFPLLLRVDQIDDSREQALSARGVTIRRRLTLLPTYAVTCSGAAGLGLLEVPWIRRVEEDRPVNAW